jgi:ERCC4-type nuclease
VKITAIRLNVSASTAELTVTRADLKMLTTCGIHWMKELILPRIAIDTREQLRYLFDGYESYRTTLATGDYSLEGFTNVLAVERKNHADAWAMLTDSRQRFERCLERMSQLDRAAIVIECSMADFCVPPPQVKRVNAATAVGSYLSWSCKYRIPVYWTENRQWGERVTLRFLAAYYKHCSNGVAIAIEAARTEALINQL